VIPAPPVDAVTGAEGWRMALPFHTYRGVAGGCVMCRESTWDWLDLAEARIGLVTDGHGVVTDQCPLHPRCAPALVAHWAVVLGVGPEDDDADAVPEPAREPEPVVPEPVRLTGAYARRANAR